MFGAIHKLMDKKILQKVLEASADDILKPHSKEELTQKRAAQDKKMQLQIDKFNLQDVVDFLDNYVDKFLMAELNKQYSYAGILYQITHISYTRKPTERAMHVSDSVQFWDTWDYVVSRAVRKAKDKFGPVQESGADDILKPHSPETKTQKRDAVITRIFSDEGLAEVVDDIMAMDLGIRGEGSVLQSDMIDTIHGYFDSSGLLDITEVMDDDDKALNAIHKSVDTFFDRAYAAVKAKGYKIVFDWDSGVVESGADDMLQPHSAEIQKQKRDAAIVRIFSDEGFAEVMDDIMQFILRAGWGDVLQSDINDTINGYFAESGLIDITVDNYKDDEFLEKVEALETEFIGKVYAAVTEKGYRIDFDWDSGVAYAVEESEADDLLQPHTPEVLAQKKEERIAKMQPFIKKYLPDLEPQLKAYIDTKVPASPDDKKALMDLGIGSGQTSMTFLISVYAHKIRPKIAQADFIHTQTYWDAFDFIKNAAIAYAKEKYPEWAKFPRGTVHWDESKADDILQPHSDEVQQQKADAQFDRREKIKNKYLPNLRQDLIKYVKSDMFIKDVNKYRLHPADTRPGIIGHLVIASYEMLHDYAWMMAGRSGIPEEYLDEIEDIIGPDIAAVDDGLGGKMITKGGKLVGLKELGVLETGADDLLQPHPKDVQKQKRDDRAKQFVEVLDKYRPGAYDTMIKYVNSAEWKAIVKYRLAGPEAGSSRRLAFAMRDETLRVLNITRVSIKEIPEDDKDLLMDAMQDLSVQVFTAWMESNPNIDESEADDILQPHSPELQQHKKDAALKQAMAMLNDDAKAHVIEIMLNVQEYSEILFDSDADGNDVMDALFDIAIDADIYGPAADDDMYLEMLGDFLVSIYNEVADPSMEIESELGESKADDILKPHSDKIRLQKKEEQLKAYFDKGAPRLKGGEVYYAISGVHKRQKTKFIATGEMYANYDYLWARFKYEFNYIDDTKKVIRKTQTVTAYWYEERGLFRSNHYGLTLASGLEEANADDILKPHSAEIQQQRKDEREERQFKVVDEYRPGAELTLRNYLDSDAWKSQVRHAKATMPKPYLLGDPNRALVVHLYPKLRSKTLDIWEITPTTYGEIPYQDRDDFNDGMSALMIKVFNEWVREELRIDNNDVTESEADDLLQPHSDEVQQQKRATVLQRYYDQGMQKDIKQGDKIEAYGSLFTDKGYFFRPITFTIDSTSLFSTGDPYLRGKYSYYDKGGQLHTIASPATWTKINNGGNVTVWGWNVGQIDVSDYHIIGIEPVVESKADDILQPHSEEVQKERLKKLFKHYIDVGDREAYPGFTNDVIAKAKQIWKENEVISDDGFKSTWKNRLSFHSLMINAATKLIQDYRGTSAVELFPEFYDILNFIEDVDTGILWESNADDILQPHSAEEVQQKTLAYNKALQDIIKKYKGKKVIQNGDISRWYVHALKSKKLTGVATISRDFNDKIYMIAVEVRAKDLIGTGFANYSKVNHNFYYFYDEGFSGLEDEWQPIGVVEAKDADSILKPHGIAKQQELRAKMMQAHYDEGMPKSDDIKKGMKLIGYCSVRVGPTGPFGHFVLKPITLTILEDGISISQWAPWIVCSYKASYGGDDVPQSVSANWEGLTLGGNELYGWYIGGIGNGVPVIEAKADDILKPHKPRAAKLIQKKRETMLAKLQARLPELEPKFVEYLKSHPEVDYPTFMKAVDPWVNEIYPYGSVEQGFDTDAADIVRQLTSKLWYSVVRESEADDVLKPHSPETLAYREEDKRVRRANFTKIYPDRSKVKQAGSIGGLSTGKEIPLSQKLTGTLYYDRSFTTITVGVDQSTLGDLVHYSGNPRESLNLTYNMGKNLADYDDFVAEWKPADVKEDKADDVLQPHSAKHQEQKKEEQVKRAVELKNKYFPHLKSELLKWLVSNNAVMPNPNLPDNMDNPFWERMFTAAWEMIPRTPGDLDEEEQEFYDEVFYLAVEEVQDIYYSRMRESKAKDADNILQPHSSKVQRQKKAEQQKRVKAFVKKYLPDVKAKLWAWAKSDEFDKRVDDYTSSKVDAEVLIPDEVGAAFTVLFDQVWEYIPRSVQGYDQADPGDILDDAVWDLVDEVYTAHWKSMAEAKDADSILQPHSQEVLKQKQEKRNAWLKATYEDKGFPDLYNKLKKLGELYLLKSSDEDLTPVRIRNILNSHGHEALGNFVSYHNYDFYDDIVDAYYAMLRRMFDDIGIPEGMDESKADNILQPHSPEELKKLRVKKIAKFAKLEREYLPTFRRELVAYARSKEYMDDSLAYEDKHGANNRWRVLDWRANLLARRAMGFKKIGTLIIEIEELVDYISQLVFDTFVIGVPRNESKVQEDAADDVLKPFTEDEVEQRDEARLEREMEAAEKASADAWPEVWKEVTSEEFLTDLFSYDEVPGDITNWLHDKVDYITGGRPQNIDQGSWDDEVAYFIAKLMDKFVLDLSKRLRKELNIVDEAGPRRADGFRLRGEVPGHEIQEILTNDIANQLLRAMSGGEYFKMLFDPDYLEDPLRTVLIDKTDIPDEIEDEHWFWEGHIESEMEGFVPQFIEEVDRVLGPSKYQGEEQPSFNFTESEADDLLQPHTPEVKWQKKEELVKRMSDDIYKLYGVRPWDRVKQIAPINRSMYQGIKNMTGTVEHIPGSDSAEIQVRLDRRYPPDVSRTLSRYMAGNPILYPAVPSSSEYVYVGEFKKEWAPVNVEESKADDVLQPHAPKVQQQKKAELQAKQEATLKKHYPDIDIDMVKMELRYYAKQGLEKDMQQDSSMVGISQYLYHKTWEIIGEFPEGPEGVDNDEWRAVDAIVADIASYVYDSMKFYYINNILYVEESKADDVLQPHTPEEIQRKEEKRWDLITQKVSALFSVKDLAQTLLSYATSRQALVDYRNDKRPSIAGIIIIQAMNLVGVKKWTGLRAQEEFSGVLWELVEYLIDAFNKKHRPAARESKADDVLQPHPPEVKQQKKEDVFKEIVGYASSSIFKFIQSQFADVKDGIKWFEKDGPPYTMIGKHVDSYIAYHESAIVVSFQEVYDMVWRAVKQIAGITEANADDILQPHSPEVKQQKREIGLQAARDWSDDSKAGYPKLRKTFEEFVKQHKHEYKTVGQLQGVLYKLGIEMMPDCDYFFELDLHYSLGNIAKLAYDIANSDLPTYRTVGESGADDILKPHSKDQQYVMYLKHQQKQDAILKKYAPNLKLELERWVNDPKGLQQTFRETRKTVSGILYDKALALAKPYPEGMASEEKSDYIDLLFDISQEAYNSIASVEGHSYIRLYDVGGGDQTHRVGESEADDILQPHTKGVQLQKMQARIEGFKKTEAEDFPQLRGILKKHISSKGFKKNVIFRLDKSGGSIVNAVFNELIEDAMILRFGGPTSSQWDAFAWIVKDIADEYAAAWELRGHANESEADDVLQPHSGEVQLQKKTEVQKKQKAFNDKYENKYVMQISNITYDATVYPDSMELIGQLRFVNFIADDSFAIMQIRLTDDSMTSSTPSYFYYNEDEFDNFEREWRVMSERDKAFYNITEDRTADDILQPHSPEEKQKILDIQLKREREWHKAHNGKHVTQIGDIDRPGLFTYAADRELTGVIGFEIMRSGEDLMFVKPDEELEELNEWDNKLYYYNDEYELFEEEWEIDA